MILYHGTSEDRLRMILAEDRLEATGPSPAVSLSTRIGPAKYWANMSAWADTSEAYVLRLNAQPLLEARYTLMPFSDTIYGEGACDWEREVRIEADVTPLSSFLRRYDPVPWDENRKKCPLHITVWANRLGS